MKITKSQLKQIIKEEILKTLNEESDSLKIISLEPWRKPLGSFGSISSPAGAGKMQAEYNGETYTFYTALTADEKDVQIYDDTDTEVSEAFSEEQEQQIIAKMTIPEWKKETEEEELGNLNEADANWWVKEMQRVLTEIKNLHDAIRRNNSDDLELFEDYFKQNVGMNFPWINK